MDEGIIAIFAMLSFWGTIAFIGQLYFRSRNRERMALIERGVDASIFATKPRGISLTLRLALFAMGIGIGVLLGELLHMMGLLRDVSFPAMILVCGGLGLLFAYLMDERAIRKNPPSYGKTWTGIEEPKESEEKVY
jgi:hypothetical protein